MKSVEKAIYQFARTSPEKVAVKSGKVAVTYRQLLARIIKARELLQGLPNYEAGRCVILGASKQIEFVYLYFGAHLAGLAVVPLDLDTNPNRFSHICSSVNPICVIGLDKCETAGGHLSLKSFTHINEVKASEYLLPIQFPNGDSIADILFTTGTTGEPKGVPLTFKNETAAARNINSFIQNRSNDVELLALPVSHSFGLGRLRCCLANGQTIILLGSFVNTKKLFRTIEEEQVTGFSMVPASWRFLQKLSGEKLAEYSSQLNYMELGSAYLSEEEKRNLSNLFPKTRIAMHYGLTEASRSAFMEFHSDANHLDSVGKASPNTDIQIFSETGDRLSVSQEGEICIKGDHVAEGYYSMKKADSFFGDYFRTGDAGFVDNEGYIYLKSRIKELINVGGKKVSPNEVDEKILKIEGVLDCACVGKKDSEGIMGEVVKAFVVKKRGCSLTAEDIKAQLSSQLESYKIPAEIEWIESIPRTNNGKVLRIQLQERE